MGGQSFELGTQNSGEFRVFVSSTFHDMVEEREHLMKQVFPEVRRICLERGVQFTEIDLRWGITEEQSRKGRIIRTCLDEVVRHGPYVIGLIGARYGWVPTLDDIANDAVLLQRYPWIEEAVVVGRSMVEIETLESARHTPGVADRLRFYGCDYARSDRTGEQEQIAAFYERARLNGIPLCAGIGSLEELGKAIRNDLLSIIDTIYPASAHESAPLVRERRAHEAFAATRRRAYVEQPASIRALDEFVLAGEADDDMTPPKTTQRKRRNSALVRNLPLVVTGGPGSGKSALLAYWSERYRRTHPDAFVITHYVGATSASTDNRSLLRRIMAEIQARYDIRERTLPDAPEGIETEFSYWLARVRKESLVIVVDALNQMDSISTTTLRWLPEYLPPNVRLIVSTLDGEILERLTQRGCRTLRIAPLNRSDRTTAIRRYLEEYGKHLSKEHTHRVTMGKHSGNPLFLRTSLEELRLFGAHDELPRKIDELLAADDLDELFQKVLERVEHDYGRRLVQDTLTLIWASRRGLSETELMEILRPTRLRMTRLLSALEYRLMRRDGLLTFFHDHLRKAVERRYIGTGTKRKNAHRRLARYFAEQLPTRRRAEEEPWQWNQAGSVDGLCGSICDIELFHALYTESARHEILGYWSAIGDPAMIVERYRDSLRDFERRSNALQTANVLQDLGECMCKGALFDEATILLQRAYGAYTSIQDLSPLAVSEVMERIGDLQFSIGNVREAEEMLRRSLAIRRNILPEHDPLIARSLSSLGAILYNLGSIDEAQRIIRMAVMINETAYGPEHLESTYALNNLAATYQATGDYRSAVWYVQQALQILINHNGAEHPDTSLTMMNLGRLHKDLGDYDKAEQLYRQAIAVDERILGDAHPRMATHLATLSMLMKAKGDLQAAETLLMRALSICRKNFSDTHLSTATTLLNLAGVLKEQRRYEESKRCYEQALQVIDATLGADHPKSKAAYKGYTDLLQNLHSEGDIDRMTRP